MPEAVRPHRPAPGRRMRLEDILYTQGFGTRRACQDLIGQGVVSVDGQTCRAPGQDFAVADLRFQVRGQDWPYHAKVCLMLHKPAGFECSHKPKSWPSVYSLLPLPLRLRPQKGAVPGVQAVGRLDQDTTGLLLLTDDGKLLHRLNSPRHQVPKVYEVATDAPVGAALRDLLLAGVVLHDELVPVRAAACEITGERSLTLTLTQGKYHQVKRMLAAGGNQVAALHRSRVGSLVLPPTLAPGKFSWLTPAQIDGLLVP
jgi:16S rRNA pseudouridine516 synthase